MVRVSDLKSGNSTCSSPALTTCIICLFGVVPDSIPLLHLHTANHSTLSQLGFLKLLSTDYSSGACFSEVPKLFGRILGDIILFVSSKQRRVDARNFAFIFTFIPFTTDEETSFTE